MALRIPRAKNLFYKSLNSFYILHPRNEHTRKKSMLITADALDEFTTQLLQKKVTKWDILKDRARSINIKDCKVAAKYHEDRLSSANVDTTFQSALEANNNANLIVLIQQCMKHNLAPSLVILMNLLSHFSMIGNCDVLNRIIRLCEVVQPDILATNSNFAHYIAEAISVNGDTNTAIDIFEKVYIENTYLRRKIRFMLRFVVLEVVSNRSEAAIVALVKFTEKLWENHKDIYPLAYMWEACFLSEWFAEQKRAIDILNTHQCSLLQTITGRLNSVTITSLKKQQIDPVLRLLEYFLECKLQIQYSILLITMFDYNYKRCNLNACKDIVSWSKKYKISLSNGFDDKYLDLILNQMRNESMKMVVEKYVNDFKF